jgi:hypothetical protein
MRRVQIVGPSASPPEHVSQYSAGNAVFWLLFACYRPILAIAALQAEQIAVRRTPAATECGFGYRSLRAAIRRLRGVLPLRSLLALPDDSQISNADRSALTRGFAQQHFVGKGLPVQIDLHRDGQAKEESQVVNTFAQLLVATRQLEGGTVHRLKYTDEVRHAWGHGKRFVADGPDWSERWATFQNDWFIGNGKDIKVDPVLPYATVYLGAKRFQHPLHHRVQNYRKIKELNTQVAHDPAAAFAYLREANALDDRSIDRFLWKFITDPQELSAVREKVVKLRSAQRG